MPDPIEPAPSAEPDDRMGQQPATESSGEPSRGSARANTPVGGSDVPAAQKNTPWPRLARADDFADQPSPTERRGPAGIPSSLLTTILMQVCGFGLLLGGYFLGQAWSHTSAQESVASGGKAGFARGRIPRATSDRSLDAAGRALKEERIGDLRGARAIYEEMIKRQAPLPGAEYRLALLCLHEGDLFQTELHLDRSLTAGDKMADCYLLRASLAGMKSNYSDASVQLAAAVRAEPFSARFCFCWGESLRREGKTASAIERLTQTLDRPDSGPNRELYLFKLRLAKVEAGKDEVVNAELANHASSSSASGDWLLLAAAQAIGRQDYAATTAFLDKAKHALAPDVYGTYVQDYVFQTQAGRPELRPFLAVQPTVVPARDAPIQDPAVWTAAEADPAVWPPFPTTE